MVGCCTAQVLRLSEPRPLRATYGAADRTARRPGHCRNQPAAAAKQGISCHSARLGARRATPPEKRLMPHPPDGQAFHGPPPFSHPSTNTSSSIDLGQLALIWQTVPTNDQEGRSLSYPPVIRRTSLILMSQSPPSSLEMGPGAP